MDLTIIDTILNTDTITQHLDSLHKEWYLKLFSNNTFYFQSSPSNSFFPENGPLLELQSTNMESEEKEEPMIISVDTIQQHLLRYGITEEHINKFILAHVECNGLSFLLGKITHVKDFKVTTDVYYCEEN